MLQPLRLVEEVEDKYVRSLTLMEQFEVEYQNLKERQHDIPGVHRVVMLATDSIYKQQKIKFLNDNYFHCLWIGFNNLIHEISNIFDKMHAKEIIDGHVLYNALSQLFYYVKILNFFQISLIFGFIVKWLNKLPETQCVDIRTDEIHTWSDFESQQLILYRLIIKILIDYKIFRNLLQKRFGYYSFYNDKNFMNFILKLNGYVYKYPKDKIFKQYVKELIKFEIDILMEKKMEKKLKNNLYVLYDIQKIIYFYDDRRIIRWLQHKTINKIYNNFPNKMNSIEIDGCYLLAKWCYTFITQCCDNYDIKIKIKIMISKLKLKLKLCKQKNYSDRLIDSLKMLKSTKCFLQYAKHLRICENDRCKILLDQCHNVNFKKCGACKTVVYCSRKCQKYHWNKIHRYNCKLFCI